MVRVTVPIPGRPYDVCVGSGTIASIGIPAPRPARSGDGLRRGRPDGGRPVVRAARVLVRRGGAGDGPADRARGRSGQDVAGVRDPAASARHPGGASGRCGGRAGWGSGGRSRRFRRVHVHARRAVHPGADDAAGPGRRGDRRQGGRQPAGRQEPGGDVLAAAAGGRRRRHAARVARPRVPLGARRGREVRRSRWTSSSWTCWSGTPARSSNETHPPSRRWWPAVSRRRHGRSPRTSATTGRACS